jgi:hypothetical protein
MRSPVRRQRGHQSSFIVLTRNPLLGVETFPVVHPKESAWNGVAGSGPNVERAAPAESRPIVKDELMIGQPGGPKRLERPGIVSLALTPKHPVLVIEIGAVGEVEHERV